MKISIRLAGGTNYVPDEEPPRPFPSIAAARRYVDRFTEDQIVAEDCEFHGFVGTFAPGEFESLRDPIPDFILRRGPRGGIRVERV